MSDWNLIMSSSVFSNLIKLSWFIQWSLWHRSVRWFLLDPREIQRLGTCFLNLYACSMFFFFFWMTQEWLKWNLNTDQQLKLENKRWNWSSSTKFALSASWTHGLIVQSVRVSERNSVVAGSNPTQTTASKNVLASYESYCFFLYLCSLPSHFLFCGGDTNTPSSCL